MGLAHARPNYASIILGIIGKASIIGYFFIANPVKDVSSAYEKLQCKWCKAQSWIFHSGPMLIIMVMDTFLGIIGKILSIIGQALIMIDNYHATPVGKSRHNAVCMHNSKADA